MDAKRIPAPGAISHLELLRAHTVDDPPGRRLQIGNVETRAQVAEVPADICRNQVKHLRSRWGEAADLQVRVEHEDRRGNALEQILEVVADSRYLQILALELTYS